MIRSVIAVVGGFAIMAFVMLVLTIVAAVALGAEAGKEPHAYFVAVVGAAMIGAAVGGYATASLAPGRHAAHVTALVVTVVCMQASAAFDAPANQPKWVNLAQIVLAPLAAWAAGRVRIARRATAPAAGGGRPA
jgi:hypothetical protein